MGISHAFVAIVALLPCGSAWVWLPMMRQASSWLQVRPNPTGTAVLGTPGAAWHGRSSRAVHMTALDGEDDAETVEALKTKVLAMEQALAQTQAAFADAMVKHHERRLAESQEAAKTLKQEAGARAEAEEQVVLYQKEMSQLLVRQHQARLEAIARTEEAYKGQLSAAREEMQEYQATMERRLLDEQDAREAAIAEAQSTMKEELAAANVKIEQYQQEMGTILVRQHESRLAAIESAEKPLKGELEQLRLELGDIHGEATGLREQLRRTLVNAGKARQEDMMELKKEIESLNKGIADRDAQIEEAKQAFSDYMVSAHNKKLQELEKLKGELESKAAATNEELLGRFQKLKKDLDEIKTIRDEYIKERELEMAAMGDAP